MINKFFNKFLDFPYYLLTYNKKQRKVEKRWKKHQNKTTE